MRGVKRVIFEELDYVIRDNLKEIVVDFFTGWLPAPIISFLSCDYEINIPDKVEAFKGLLGSIPDCAFQKNLVGNDWNLSHGSALALVGDMKMAGVRSMSCIGAVASSNVFNGLILHALWEYKLGRASPLTEHQNLLVLLHWNATLQKRVI